MRYSDDSREQAGIQRLVRKGVYSAAYPLHDGEYDYHNETENERFTNERRVCLWEALYTYKHCIFNASL